MRAYQVHRPKEGATDCRDLYLSYQIQTYEDTRPNRVIIFAIYLQRLETLLSKLEAIAARGDYDAARRCDQLSRYLKRVKGFETFEELLNHEPPTELQGTIYYQPIKVLEVIR